MYDISFVCFMQFNIRRTHVSGFDVKNTHLKISFDISAKKVLNREEVSPYIIFPFENVF